jgi:hypothetical protein
MDGFHFYEDDDNLYRQMGPRHQMAFFSFDDKPFNTIELNTTDDPHTMFLIYRYHIPCEPGCGFIIDDEYEDENGNVHPERRADFNEERRIFVLQNLQRDLNDVTLNEIFNVININAANYSIDNWEYGNPLAGQGMPFQEYLNMPINRIQQVASGDFHRIYPEDEVIHIDEEDDL